MIRLDGKVRLGVRRGKIFSGFIVGNYFIQLMGVGGDYFFDLHYINNFSNTQIENK